MNTLWRDPVVRSIVGGTALIAVLLLAVLFLRDTVTTTMVIPWFVPMMNSFLVLVAACVTFLALGKFTVLRDPASFWIALGFSGFAVGALFNVFTFPGLLPTGQSILGQHGNTAIWVGILALHFLALGLLVAALTSWPGPGSLPGRNWCWPVVGWVVFTIVLNVSCVIFEQKLPLHILPNGNFASLVLPHGMVLSLVAGIGTVLSTSRYVRTGDALSGYAAHCQQALLGFGLLVLVEVTRYDLWWFAQRTLLVVGFLLMLFGLLAEYVHLFRREREMSGQLHRLNEELEFRVDQRTAELAAVNKELEAFAYTISHDLRAPLRHVKGFAELLNEQIGSTVDDRGREYLKIITESVDRMDNLIDDLLALSRLGRVPMRLTEVDLRKLVDEVIKALAPTIKGRAIDWQISPLPKVHADPSLMHNVFNNLIGNALKYTRRRERACIEIGSEQRDGEVTFFIRDNGAGFDMQFVAKLFGVFQRLHVAEEFEGNGIGLASVRRIIQRHGGRVWAEGEVDRGASFYFTLPKN